MPIKEFFKEEIMEAFFGSYDDGAPGPDGISLHVPPDFLVKYDLIEMFNA
jgi:hypothetical protein